MKNLSMFLFVVISVNVMMASNQERHSSRYSNQSNFSGCCILEMMPVYAQDSGTQNNHFVTMMYGKKLTSANLPQFDPEFTPEPQNNRQKAPRVYSHLHNSSQESSPLLAQDSLKLHSCCCCIKNCCPQSSLTRKVVTYWFPN